MQAIISCADKNRRVVSGPSLGAIKALAYSLGYAPGRIELYCNDRFYLEPEQVIDLPPMFDYQKEACRAS
jgi:hypothetical protein